MKRNLSKRKTGSCFSRVPKRGSCLFYIVVLMTVTLAFPFELLAQQTHVEISGVVTNASDGSTLPGVNIIIKGTTQGTVTNFDGKYTIPAPTGATLVFTYIG